MTSRNQRKIAACTAQCACMCKCTCSWVHSCTFWEHVVIEASSLCKHQNLPAVPLRQTTVFTHTNVHPYDALIKRVTLFLFYTNFCLWTYTHISYNAINKHTHAMPPSVPESPVLACLHHQTLGCAPSVCSLLTVQTHIQTHTCTALHQ